MLEVMRNGKTFDLENVSSAVSWAYDRAIREDQVNMAKNCAPNLRRSPLTSELEAAQSLLMEIRMHSGQPFSQPGIVLCKDDESVS